MVNIIGITTDDKYRIVEDTTILPVSTNKKYINLTEALIINLEIDWIYHNEIQLHKIIWLICENRLRNYFTVGMDTILPEDKRRSYYTFYCLVMKTLNSQGLDNLFAMYKLTDADRLVDAKNLLKEL